MPQHKAHAAGKTNAVLILPQISNKGNDKIMAHTGCVQATHIQRVHGACIIDIVISIVFGYNGVLMGKAPYIANHKNI